MRKRGLRYTPLDWREAYNESVRKALGYLGFKSSGTDTEFQALLDKYPEVDPLVFMQANFSPHTVWQIWKQGRYQEIKYPYLNMLKGDKAQKAYEKAVRRGLTEVLSIKEQIVTAVDNSLERLKQCKVDLHNYEVLWDMYLMGIMSPFLIVVVPGMRRWIEAQVRNQTITLEEYKLVKEKETLMLNYTSILPKVYKLVGAYA